MQLVTKRAATNCYAQNTQIYCAPSSTLCNAYWPLMMIKEKEG